MLILMWDLNRYFLFWMLCGIVQVPRIIICCSSLKIISEYVPSEGWYYWIKLFMDFPTFNVNVENVDFNVGFKSLFSFWMLLGIVQVPGIIICYYSFLWDCKPRNVFRLITLQRYRRYKV